MNFATLAAAAAERAPLPDRDHARSASPRWSNARAAASTSRRERRRAASPQACAACRLPRRCADANAQHYEVPAAFFDLVLGPQRKYSCCLFPTAETIAGRGRRGWRCRKPRSAPISRRAAHPRTGLRLGIAVPVDGARLSRTRASSRYRTRTRSAQHIQRQAPARGLTNLEVVTADMNTFAPDRTFDRVVSVEMFEHMANWRALLGNVRTWLKPDGRLFVHVFAHRSTPYRFDHTEPVRLDRAALLHRRPDAEPAADVRVRRPCSRSNADWWWNGQHYERTADALAGQTSTDQSDAVRRALQRRSMVRDRALDASLAPVLPRHRQACSDTAAATSGASHTTF